MESIMKTRLAALAWIAAAFLLASCASLLGPREVEIPLARLQQAVASRFPFNNRYLQLLEVRVTNPHIALQPDANRILTSMDVSMAPPFTDKTWSGSLSISGQLQVDSARNAVVLADPACLITKVMAAATPRMPIVAIKTRRPCGWAGRRR